MADRKGIWFFGRHRVIFRKKTKVVAVVAATLIIN